MKKILVIALMIMISVVNVNASDRATSNMVAKAKLEKQYKQVVAEYFKAHKILSKKEYNTRMHYSKLYSKAKYNSDRKKILKMEKIATKRIALEMKILGAAYTKKKKELEARIKKLTDPEEEKRKKAEEYRRKHTVYVELVEE